MYLFLLLTFVAGAAHDSTIINGKQVADYAKVFVFYAGRGASADGSMLGARYLYWCCCHLRGDHHPSWSRVRHKPF